MVGTCFRLCGVQQLAIKAIAISGHALAQNIVRSKEAGFAEYLLKPVNIQTIDDAVTKVLSRTQEGVQ